MKDVEDRWGLFHGLGILRTFVAISPWLGGIYPVAVLLTLILDHIDGRLINAAGESWKSSYRWGDYLYDVISYIPLAVYAFGVWPELSPFLTLFIVMLPLMNVFILTTEVWEVTLFKPAFLALAFAAGADLLGLPILPAAVLGMVVDVSMVESWVYHQKFKYFSGADRFLLVLAASLLWLAYGHHILGGAGGAEYLLLSPVDEIAALTGLKEAIP